MEAKTSSSSPEKSGAAIGASSTPGKAKRALSGLAAALLVFFTIFVTAFLMGANNPANTRPEVADKLAIAMWFALLPLIIAGTVAGLKARKSPFGTSLGVSLLVFAAFFVLTHFIYPSL